MSTEGVPAGAPVAPRARPAHVPLAGRDPDGDVEGVLLGRVVWVVVVLLGQPQCGVEVKAHACRSRRRARVHRAVRDVGGVAFEQRCAQLQHVADRLSSRGVVVRGAHPQRRHRRFETGALQGGQHGVRLTAPQGLGEQDLVDVRDVACQRHPVAVPAQDAVDGVGPDVGRGVPEVRDVVRGDTADVHPHVPDHGHRPPEQPERFGRKAVPGQIHPAILPPPG
jgi:hypothetical protein